MEQTITVKLDTEMIDAAVRTTIANIIKGITSSHFMLNHPTLNAGEEYAGLILGKDGAADHHLILLPAKAEGMKWQAAMDWAAAQSGELPTRREQSLLFANLKEQFEQRWYWSAEEHPSDAHCAFVQNFYGGIQDDGRRGTECCARAVRRELVI